MKIKEGVVLAGLDIKMRRVLIEAEDVWHFHGEELVVTSGLEGTHSAYSFHYYGLALDFRHRYFSEDVRKIAVEDLQLALGKSFDVVLEKTHIHVEYDPDY